MPYSTHSSSSSSSSSKNEVASEQTLNECDIHEVAINLIVARKQTEDEDDVEDEDDDEDEDDY